MRTEERAWLCALLLLSAGSCYQLDQTSGKFFCDRPGDVCPEGQSCIAGRCVVPDLSAAPEDLLGGEDLASFPDLRVPDLSRPDLSRPDLSTPPDMTGQPMCISVVPALVFACPGVVVNGNMAALCQVFGFRACGTGDATLASAAGSASCTGLQGFYATAIDISLKGKDRDECKSPPEAKDRALVGCGTSAGVEMLNKSGECWGLKQHYPCGGQGDWTCSTVADASNLGSRKGGALCCK